MTALAHLDSPVTVAVPGESTVAASHTTAARARTALDTIALILTRSGLPGSCVAKHATADAKVAAQRFPPPANGNAPSMPSEQREKARPTEVALVRLTLTERRRYKRWWVESSGLSGLELRQIANGIWADRILRLDARR